MICDPKCSSPLRILVLTGDKNLAVLPQGDEGRMEVVCLECAYEAASELLVAPAVALLLDLRRLHPRHVHLLALARQTHTRTYAFGHLPAGIQSAEFDGVTMIDRSEVAATLQRLARMAQNVAEDAPSPVAAPAAAIAEPSPQEISRNDLIDLAPIPLSQNISPLNDDDELDDLFEQATEELVPEAVKTPAPAEVVVPRRRSPAESPRKWAGKTQANSADPSRRSPAQPVQTEREGLLTSQELAALLETKP